MRPRRVCALVVTTALLSGCFIIRHTVIREVGTTEPRRVASPARVHLLNGSTALVRTPWEVARDTVFGQFAVYDAQLQLADSVSAIPLERVAGIETYTGRVLLPPTMLIAGLELAGTISAAVSMANAFYGSCPTIYSDSAGVERLESEGFSYSIAPIFEARDVDYLHARPGPDGEIRLTVRDEAAETHYINHVELLAVRHDAGESVAPDANGLPLAMRGWLPYRAVNRDGRDVTVTLAAADTMAYASDSAALEALDDSAALHDWIQLALPAVDADSVAILIRARNSLLTTVLLYDQMLASQGARAVDWIGRDLADLGHAMTLGRWAARELGLHVQIDTGSGWQDVARLGDPGPIAWEETAVMVPVTRGQATTVRLRFATDAWRLDQIRIAGTVRRPAWHTIAADSLLDARGHDHDDLRRRIAEADSAYVVTQPGSRFVLTFPTSAADSADQFLLAIQGYYIEWIRPAWAARPDAGPFRPGAAPLRRALEQWRHERHSFERRFFESRLAAR